MKPIQTKMTPVQGALMLPKDVTTHNQIETLSAAFALLASALNPVIVPRMDAPPEIIPNSLDKGVKTSIETALITVCNRISDLMQESERWNTGDPEIAELYKASMIANIQLTQAQAGTTSMMGALLKQGEKKRKKGPTNEEK